MDRPIDRRDFLNGVAVAIGALGRPSGRRASAEAAGGALAAGPAGLLSAAARPACAAAIRARSRTPTRCATAISGRATPALEDTGETYDLVIVGGGISGLSAAHFYRAARPDARILILDNHDDFGGHAKRNEFHLDGKLHLLNGGTLEIDSPRPYSPAADGLLKTLGIDPAGAEPRPATATRSTAASACSHGVFFDKETFGVDRLVAGAPAAGSGQGGSWPDFARPRRR